MEEYTAKLKIKVEYMTVARALSTIFLKENSIIEIIKHQKDTIELVDQAIEFESTTPHKIDEMSLVCKGTDFPFILTLGRIGKLYSSFEGVSL